MENGKQISRKDLYESDSSSNSSDNESNSSQQVREAFKHHLGPLNIPPIPTDHPQSTLALTPSAGAAVNTTTNSNIDPDPDPDELEFRLFAAPTAATATTATPSTQRIKLHSPHPDDLPSGFVVPHRPHSHYFRDHVDALQRAQLLAAAVSGDQVRERARVSWPGCRVAWRVVRGEYKHGTGTGGGGGEGGEGGGQDVVGSREGVGGQSLQKRARARSRPGKKSRLAKRLKREIAKKVMAEREVRLREKKTSKNRSQKLKRREKARNAKAAVLAENESPDGS